MSRRGALTVVGLLVLFGSSSGQARLSELEIAFEDGRISVSFELDGALDEELIERIEAGLPSGFTYHFQLVRPNRYWFDNKLKSSELEVVALYNAVTHEYTINYRFDDKLISSRVVTERGQLEEAMTRFESLSLFSLEDLPQRRLVHLRARAELGSRNLLLLIPTTVHTDWVASERFRPAEVFPQ